MPIKSNTVDLGFNAVDFSLLNIDNKFYNLSEIKKKEGVVIAFICNHCPYVKDIIHRMVEDFKYLQLFNIGIVAIMPNDTVSYPEDSFENMKQFSKKNNFNFPYLIDAEQTVARKYGAVCTPDFYCFNKDDKLFYRGRLDNVGYRKESNNRDKSLVNAFKSMLKGDFTEDQQISSMGCSIKWKVST